jgi:ubiquinone/menaquinone biosynthesis C-methylase UbiE
MESDPKRKDFYTYDADHRFAAMYPLLARQILDDYGENKNIVLDIGTGGGPLLIELAKISDLTLIGLDKRNEALEFARRNMEGHHLPPGRITLFQGDAHNIPLADDAADLIISRGSIPFWEDMAASFADIRRVLAPGGIAFIGCGFSRRQPLEEIRRMRPAWSEKGREDARNDWKKEGRLQSALKKATIKHYEITRDEYGVWVKIDKPSRAPYGVQAKFSAGIPG